MIDQYMPMVIDYIVTNNTVVITVSCLLASIAVLYQKREFDTRKVAKKARREARRKKRFEDTNHSIRLKVRRAEKRRKENKGSAVLGLTVEELGEKALRRTLEELQRSGKSTYDPDKTIRIYYPNTFDPKKLGKC
ncbi:hypothetical protein LCGC14_0838810 [marine sediment metagenome]|uniref:Uncharacterized protein n=1 Tax=marine sediment metagenome TaxID=412755 RepID=A0A0F9PZ05_9ZZZZ